VSRVAVVLARPPIVGAAPPGVPPDEYALALLEDTYEAVADLAGVQTMVAVPPAEHWPARVASVLWPSTPVLEVSEPGMPLERVVAQVLTRAPATADLVLVAGDAPDLPGLVVAKVFSAGENVPVAAAPALRGGLVVLGCRLPVAGWLVESDVGIDTVDAVPRLQVLAPPGSLTITQPWRRLREPADIASLDPGLEGWAATRALLAAPDRRPDQP
jgi:hypothetical protein